MKSAVRPHEAFDPVDRQFHVLGVRTCADIPVGVEGSAYDPWQIAGETSDPPDGTNDETGGGSDYANASALEPGHVWPFMSLGATLRSDSQSAPSTISAGGYYPACYQNEQYNHYRRFVRLAPRMFGSDGRLFEINACGLLKATNAANVLDIVLHHDLVTALPSTSFTAGKYTGFRFPLGALGSAEVPFWLRIVGKPMGPYKSVWTGRLIVAAQTAGGVSDPDIDLTRMAYMDLAGTGPNMDTQGSDLAFLFAARRSTAISFDTIGSAGGAAQDGSEVYCKMGLGHGLLWPGN